MTEPTAGGADPIARIHAMLDDPATDVFLFGVRMMLGQSNRPALRDDVATHRTRLESIAASDPSTEHRAAAGAALATLAVPVQAPPTPSSRAGVVTRLLKKAVGNDWNKRAEAIEALAAHTDPRIAQVVLVALTDPQRLVRTAAMRAAGRLHIEEALPRLVQQDDPDVGALLAQAEALAAFGGPQADAALASEDLFTHVCRKLTRDDGVAAAKTLALLRTPELERRLAEVVVGLNADVVNGRHDSLRLLVRRGDPDAVAPLIGGVLDAARDEQSRAELLRAVRAVAATTAPTADATAATTAVVNEMGTGLPALKSMRATPRHPFGAPAPEWQSAITANDEGMAALLFG